MAVQLSYIWKKPFLHWDVFQTLSKIICACVCVHFWTPYLFHGLTSLCWCQQHTVFLWLTFKILSDSVLQFYSFRIFWLFWFLWIFIGIIGSPCQFLQKSSWYFSWDCIASKDQFWENWHLNNIEPVWLNFMLNKFPFVPTLLRVSGNECWILSKCFPEFIKIIMSFV